MFDAQHRLSSTLAYVTSMANYNRTLFFSSFLCFNIFVDLFVYLYFLNMANTSH